MLTRPLQNTRAAAPPVTVHLRLKGGYGFKSDSQLYDDCSYHDIVTLHLCLFVSQFIVLHFKTLEREERNKIRFYNKFDKCTFLVWLHYTISTHVNNSEQIYVLV